MYPASAGSIQRGSSRFMLKTTIGGILTILLLLLILRHPTTSGPLFRNQHHLELARLDDVFNRTLGFEKIFVVNLPSRTDHRDAMLLSAALSNISLSWIDGVKGEGVLAKVLPPPGVQHLSPGEIGSWRAHLNAIATVVQENLSSALIMEDDIDWDVRIKSQLHGFALSTRALTQPLSSNPSTFADPTFPSPKDELLMPLDMYFGNLPSTVTPLKSPYGDNWHLLWPGHCGTTFPNVSSASWGNEGGRQPKGKVVHLDDPTVPEAHYMGFLSTDNDPGKLYPSHTRIAHHAVASICTLAYAVTQAGARKILYDMGVKHFSQQFDLELKSFCKGEDGRQNPICVTVQPQLFNYYRPAGRTSQFSDITDHGDEVRTKAEAPMLRWSVRLNIEELVDGGTNFTDQFPDQSPNQVG